MLISVSTPRLACILVLCYELLLKSFAFTCVEYISGFIQKMVSLGILRSQMPSWFPVPLFPGCTCVKVTVVKIWSVLPELTIRQQANARDCMKCFGLLCSDVLWQHKSLRYIRRLRLFAAKRDTPHPSDCPLPRLISPLFNTPLRGVHLCSMHEKIIVWRGVIEGG